MAEITTIKAELIPEALPPKEGTDFTISVFAIGQIIPVPVVIIIMGIKKAIGLDEKEVRTNITIGPKVTKKAP